MCFVRIAALPCTVGTLLYAAVGRCSAVKAAAKAAGAYGCTISGAGPTCVAVASSQAVGEKAAAAMAAAFQAHGGLQVNINPWCTAQPAWLMINHGVWSRHRHQQPCCFSDWKTDALREGCRSRETPWHVVGLHSLPPT